MEEGVGLPARVPELPVLTGSTYTPRKKTKNTPPCPILPNMWVSADTCGGAEQCLMGQWGVRFHPDATGPEVDLRHQLPPVSTQHASSLAGVWG